MARNILTIIGGGLAGCEAAWQAAELGIEVILYEMRNEHTTTQAHVTNTLCELVCSNSLRSDDATSSAVGVLHAEMRLLNSLIIRCADAHAVPAGSALAVDRHGFSGAVEHAIQSHPLITVKRQEITSLDEFTTQPTIIASGPLTSSPLADAILQLTGSEYLAFFDAIAPIIYKDSINFDIAWFQSRYDKGNGKDYINCPLDKEQYYNFINKLNEGDKVDFKEWEKDTPYFEGCLPIEVMAERGAETLRYGPLKPVGLTNPHSDEKPYAVVQLRQDNALGTLYNIVGFQTKLNYAAQKALFTTIPGLENAEFARLGGIHRNTFIQSPTLLDNQLRLKTHPMIRFAGQITGVEGYVESATSGLLAGLFAAHELLEKPFSPPPNTTMHGALLHHVTGAANAETFQPMNINFGLLPSFEKRIPKTQRKSAYADRALLDCRSWLNLPTNLAA